MPTIFDKFNPEDVIMWTVMITCVVVISLGHDGVVKDILITIIGLYMGKKSVRGKTNGNEKENEDSK